MKSVRKFLAISLIASVPLMAQKPLTVTVTNTMGFDRNEVVAISKKELSPLLKETGEATVVVKDVATGHWQTRQWIDYDGDGNSDELLFMAAVKAHGTVQYAIMDGEWELDSKVSEIAAGQTSNLPGTPDFKNRPQAYSRFVPERTDDYAWENDRVAFRTYGPDAQQRAEQKRENGTLSSGIDLWLKSTPNPVIEKWYAGYKTDPMFYHKDRGEGYDPYHVGASRGTGGTGVWIHDSLQVSKNFTGYKTIASGPLRTVFELYYAPYSENVITETKRISLDLGSNFSKFEITYASQKPLPNYAVGITLHENKGNVSINRQEGFFAHHESIDGAYVGEGLVFAPGVVTDAFANKSKTKDQSNLVVLTKPSGSVIYYAGFAWEKGGQGKNPQEWEALLHHQVQVIQNPLVVKIEH